VGTPLELHGKPANWFVADFMGCRNLLDMTVDAAVKAGERVTASGGGLSLTGEAVNSLAKGEAVKVAIRPEDLLIRDGAAMPGDTEAVVSTTEYVGREFSVNADAGSHILHARSRVDHEPGTTVHLYADPARVLVYPAVLDRGTDHETTEVPTAAAEATA
ncbi:MAG TPA: TOBE domain-containing protein, partial [Propionibacteriaceae bacterium]|nr:TOBE domain-containing protein [Propionibacteriaceae bacterium]